ncbi:hypothetical protein [Sorangium sp. So ce1024]|uniref:hypothetical protein n=1 Tax=Sorangium sp. So ce1024 TaxID=3133327 RepID=UPI003F0757C2
MYQHVTVPEAVAHELRERARLGHAVPRLEELTWLAVEKVEHASLLRLAADLAAGARRADVSGPARAGISSATSG